jgi:hypothetical protein
MGCIGLNFATHPPSRRHPDSVLHYSEDYQPEGTPLAATLLAAGTTGCRKNCPPKGGTTSCRKLPA